MLGCMTWHGVALAPPSDVVRLKRRGDDVAGNAWSWTADVAGAGGAQAQRFSSVFSFFFWWVVFRFSISYLAFFFNFRFPAFCFLSALSFATFSEYISNLV